MGRKEGGGRRVVRRGTCRRRRWWRSHGSETELEERKTASEEITGMTRCSNHIVEIPPHAQKMFQIKLEETFKCSKERREM